MAKKAAPRDEPKEWREASERADAAREVVGQQIAEELSGRQMTGSGVAFTDRLREVSAARREGDPTVLRAAVMEATLAGAAWVVALDLRQRT